MAMLLKIDSVMRNVLYTLQKFPTLDKFPKYFAKQVCLCNYKNIFNLTT